MVFDKEDVMFLRELRIVVCAAIAVLAVTTAIAQADPELPDNTVALATSERSYEIDNIEEVYVEGVHIEPESMAIHEMEAIYQRKQSAARSFKIGNYEEAFPTLLQLARLGFKDAQARVGFIYMHGLGGQPKSNLKALGWLGVAAQGETRPQYRNIFTQMMSEVPGPQQQLVATTVADYRDRFDSEKLGVQCMRSRTGHLDKFTCRWEAEMAKQQDRFFMLQADDALPW